MFSPRKTRRRLWFWRRWHCSTSPSGDPVGRRIFLHRRHFARKCAAALFTTKILYVLTKGSRVVFNHLRLHNGSAHNVRSMEIAGIGGGAQLVRGTPELARELFTEDEHLLCFAGEDEMLHQVRQVLKNPRVARRLSSGARQRVTARHLLSHRISRIVPHLRNLDAE